jgi:hypothetical protein
LRASSFRIRASSLAIAASCRCALLISVLIASVPDAISPVWRVVTF